MVCESVNPKIPYFNAPIYLENKVIYAIRNTRVVSMSDTIPDHDRKSRRDIGAHQSSLLHNQASRGHCGYIVQVRGQVLHWWR